MVKIEQDDNLSEFSEQYEDDEEEFVEEDSDGVEESEAEVSDVSIRKSKRLSNSDNQRKQTSAAEPLSAITPSSSNVGKFRGKGVRIKHTDEGHDLKIVRIKVEDKKFDGTTVRQKQVISYITSVLTARHEFYTEMWKDMLSVYVDCAMEARENWKRSTRECLNIDRWLGTSSVGFCVNHSAVFDKNVIKKKPKKLMGRPAKQDSELKTPRRYIPKQAMPNQTSELEDENNLLPNDEDEHARECSTKIEHVPIFEARSYPFVAPNKNFGGVESNVRVADLTAELAKIYPNASIDRKANNSDDIYKHLPKNFFAGLKERRDKQLIFQALFCGGPISAMAACPRRCLSGDEVLAVSTFSDEKLLSVLDNVAHIQFWTYSSNLSSTAKLKFVLEIPDVAQILSLYWCPCFTNDFFADISQVGGSKRRSGQQKLAEKSLHNFNKTEDILGFLAVGTNVGKVLIYCIPRNLDDLFDDKSLSRSLSKPPSKKRARVSSLRSATVINSRNKKVTTNENNEESDGEQNNNINNEHTEKWKRAPLICTTTPKFVLEHPIATMKIDESNQEIFFKKAPRSGKFVAEPSASVSQYNETMMNSAVLLKKFNDFPIINLSWSPFQNGRKIAAVSVAGRVLIWDIEAKLPFNKPLIIYSSSWTSPPICISWLTNTDVCISFRLKCSRIYNIDTETCTFKEDTAKTAGQFIYSSPIIFPGFFTYDTSAVSFFDTFFAGSTYIFFDGNNYEKAMVVPLFNNHQIQISRMNVCEMSGCVASVGFDGRLFLTLNGRLTPHKGEFRSAFNICRTLLHVLIHPKSNPPEKVLICNPSKKTNSLKASLKKPNKKSSLLSNGCKSNACSDQQTSTQQNAAQIEREAMGANHDETTKGNPKLEKLCFSHTDCCENKWLEIRIGDAAMKDQLTLRRVRTKVPEASLDRRLETLSFVEQSRITPGISMSGGEAGLVFLMPCIL